MKRARVEKALSAVENSSTHVNGHDSVPDGDSIDEEIEINDEPDTEDESSDEANDEISDAPNSINGQNHDRISEPLTPLINPDSPEPEFRVVQDANGNDRYLYPEILPSYDSDDSAFEEPRNTIGNISLSYYDSYPHVGYTIDGQRIARPKKGEALDALLNTIDIPAGFTGLTDPATGRPLELNGEQLDLLRRVAQDEVADSEYDPYPRMVEYFTNTVETMPLSAAPEPKRRFIPSRHEMKRVLKIVKAIKEGRIKPYRAPPEEQEEEAPRYYDIWASDGVRNDKISNIPAPKLPRPMHDESYNPPAEYLPDEKEKKAWLEAEDEDKEKEYLPQRYDALRRVPGYERFAKERFERCLDLYLAPRIRRTHVRADAESLLPKLPSPEELRPYPSFCATVYKGHQGRVRCLNLDPSGQWLATGGDDGTVKVWELLTGRQLWSVVLSREHPVTALKWRPAKGIGIIAAAADDELYFVVPPVCGQTVEDASHELLDAGFGYAATTQKTTGKPKPPPATWTRPRSRTLDPAVSIQVSLKSPPKTISWHHAGSYLVTTSPTLSYHAIAIHNLPKHATQLPFRRLKGLPQAATFHPSKPQLFVATQQSIRVYDLQAQSLLQTLKPGARHLSSLSLHPGGSNLIAGSYDRRLLWHDLELSPKLPYKSLRYHRKAVRDVALHQGGLPLFVSAGDDGTLQVYHGRVVDDGMENVTIVPLKVLRGHEVVGSLGVLGVEWHPREAWAISCGADGTARLWM